LAGTEATLKSQIWTITGLVLLGIALIGLPACGATTQTTPIVTPPISTLPPNTSSATAPLTSPTPTDFVGISSVASKSVNGLSLSLLLNSTTFQPGQEISVVIDEQNTLATVNNVSASNGWPLRGLILGPCGTVNYPIGVAIFQGYYTPSDLSSATPLQLYQPGIYNCPMILAGINTYAFQPLSDSASVIGSCEPNPCLTDKMNSEITVTGYWINGQEATLSNFTSGLYTVVGGDEWGALAVLHFVVQGDDKSGQ
jgi:hypothetical protein